MRQVEPKIVYITLHTVVEENTNYFQKIKLDKHKQKLRFKGK